MSHKTGSRGSWPELETASGDLSSDRQLWELAYGIIRAFCSRYGGRPGVAPYLEADDLAAEIVLRMQPRIQNAIKEHGRDSDKIKRVIWSVIRTVKMGVEIDFLRAKRVRPEIPLVMDVVETETRIPLDIKKYVKLIGALIRKRDPDTREYILILMGGGDAGSVASRFGIDKSSVMRAWQRFRVDLTEAVQGA